jgi:hypothetical protein
MASRTCHALSCPTGRATSPSTRVSAFQSMTRIASAAGVAVQTIYNSTRLHALSPLRIARSDQPTDTHRGDLVLCLCPQPTARLAVEVIASSLNGSQPRCDHRRDSCRPGVNRFRRPRGHRVDARPLSRRRWRGGPPRARTSHLDGAPKSQGVPQVGAPQELKVSLAVRHLLLTTWLARGDPTRSPSAVRTLDLGGGRAVVLGRRRRALGSAPRFVRGLAVGLLTSCPRRGGQRRGRRGLAASGAPPGEEFGCADRSRSRSARLGNQDRDCDFVGELVGEVLGSDETEAERALQADDRLRWLTAFGASNDARRRGGSEVQPAAWAASGGHNRPFGV